MGRGGEGQEGRWGRGGEGERAGGEARLVLRFWITEGLTQASCSAPTTGGGRGTHLSAATGSPTPGAIRIEPN